MLKLNAKHVAQIFDFSKWFDDIGLPVDKQSDIKQYFMDNDLSSIDVLVDMNENHYDPQWTPGIKIKLNNAIKKLLQSIAVDAASGLSPLLLLFTP